MALFKSAATVGGLTLISRILGYVRDIYIARFMGASMLADAFLVAFRLPNFFRALSAEGAFNAAFVPLFSKQLTNKNKKEACHFAGNVFSFMFAILLVLTGIMEYYMPGVMQLLAPGFTDNTEQFTLAVTLARIMFPYLICISLVALMAGMLNSLGKFAAAAATPALLNLIMILSIAMASHYHVTTAHAMAWGVCIAGFIQMGWVFAALARAGMVPRLHIPTLTPPIKMLFKRMGPGLIGGGITQLNVWANTVIATLIPGTVSYLYYADRLVQFPMALIGTAIGTALLPLISKYFHEGSREKSNAVLNQALESVILLTVPAAVGMAVLSGLIISVLFEKGAFTHQDTVASAGALAAYSLGLPAFALIKILTPAYFASGDTRTPVKIALICLFMNVGMNLLLIHSLAHIGLALSTALTSWLNVIFLAHILHKRKTFSVDKKYIGKLPYILIAATVMAGILWLCSSLGTTYYPQGKLMHATLLAALIMLGVTSYFFSLGISRSYTLADIKKILRK